MKTSFHSDQGHQLDIDMLSGELSEVTVFNGVDATVIAVKVNGCQGNHAPKIQVCGSKAQPSEVMVRQGHNYLETTYYLQDILSFDHISQPVTAREANALLRIRREKLNSRFGNKHLLYRLFTP